MYFVYVLRSLKDFKRYIGFTDDLNRRISEHNSGFVKSTKNRRPLELIYSEEFNTKAVLEWEVPGKTLDYVGDLDGNGMAEFYSSKSQSSFEIYEYQSSNVKWTIESGAFDNYHLPDYDRRLMYRDFNNNNVIDIVISSDNQLNLLIHQPETVFFLLHPDKSDL